MRPVVEAANTAAKAPGRPLTEQWQIVGPSCLHSSISLLFPKIVALVLRGAAQMQVIIITFTHRPVVEQGSSSIRTQSDLETRIVQRTLCCVEQSSFRRQANARPYRHAILCTASCLLCRRWLLPAGNDEQLCSLLNSISRSASQLPQHATATFFTSASLPKFSSPPCTAGALFCRLFGVTGVFSIKFL